MTEYFITWSQYIVHHPCFHYSHDIHRDNTFITPSSTSPCTSVSLP